MLKMPPAKFTASLKALAREAGALSECRWTNYLQTAGSVRNSESVEPVVTNQVE